MLFFVFSLTSNLGISGVKGAKPLAPWCAQEWFHISQMSHEEEPPYVSIEPSIPIPRDSHSLNKVRRRERLNKCKIQSALTHFEMLVNRKYNCVWLLQCVFFFFLFQTLAHFCLFVCLCVFEQNSTSTSPKLPITSNQIWFCLLTLKYFQRRKYWFFFY